MNSSEFERINPIALQRLAANEGVPLTEDRLKAIARLSTICVILDEARFRALFGTAMALLATQFIPSGLIKTHGGERHAERQ
jgi:hypothetical protein